MEKELIINVAPHEKRIALLENKKLAEIIVERPDDQHIVGNIYKGKVLNVLPGLQSVFIDIGLDKAAFLNISDIKDNFLMGHESFDEWRDEFADAGIRGDKPLKIQDLFKNGQDVVVQVVKEPLSTKGPRVTNSISIPGRFLVLVPGTNFIGVSKKMRDRGERRRLKQLISSLKPDNIGFIVRTIGNKMTDREFEAEIKDLLKKWNALKKAAEKKKPPFLLYEEEGLVSVTIRDLFSSGVHRLLVDSKKEYNTIHKYIKKRNPELLDRIYHYNEKPPIFEVFGIENDMEKSLRRKVWFRGGGYLIFDYAEAMNVIDVNSGRNIGRKNVEDTIYKTNVEAAREIARQVRLRDIGGLIAIDFIDMRIVKNRQKLLNEFFGMLKKDRAPFNLGKMGEFGIVLMTRKRVRENLVTAFSEICAGCNGTGRIFSKASVIARIDRCMDKIKNILRQDKVILTVNPLFAGYLAENRKKVLKEIMKGAKIKIVIEEDRHLSMDEFKIYNMDKVEEYTQVLLKEKP